MKQNYRSANEEISGLRAALEESRSNGDKLHRESELVVHNVNTWVQEQKCVDRVMGGVGEDLGENVNTSVQEQQCVDRETSLEKGCVVEDISHMNCKVPSELVCRKEEVFESMGSLIGNSEDLQEVHFVAVGGGGLNYKLHLKKRPQKKKNKNGI